MFTGIIQKVGKVQKIDGPRYWIEIGFDSSTLELGESIAVNGVCLTVAEISSPLAQFFLSEETLARTSLGKLREGSRVNLERAMVASSRLSGHIVQGHVDGIAPLVRMSEAGESRILEFDLPESIARYCVEKGSISLNGVSLTINTIEKKSGSPARISLMIIPHTWEHTQFSNLSLGEPVNVEVDIVAKYVESLCLPYQSR